MLHGPGQHLCRVHIARHHDGSIGGHVPAAVKRPHIVGGERLQVTGPADDRAAVGVGLPGGGIEGLEQHRMGLVVHPLAALLFDDFDLAAEFVIGPLVAGKAVGLQRHHGLQAVGRHLLVVRRHVAAGEGVVAPAQGGHAARILARLHTRGALEHHVLQRMGHAAGAIDLVHRAHPHPQHVNRRGRTPVRLDQQGESVGQGGAEHITNALQGHRLCG